MNHHNDRRDLIALGLAGMLAGLIAGVFLFAGIELVAYWNVTLEYIE